MMDQVIPRWGIHKQEQGTCKKLSFQLIANSRAAMDEFRTVNVLLLHGLRGRGTTMVKRMQEILLEWSLRLAGVDIGQDGLLLEYMTRRIV